MLALIALALSIGASSAMFSVMDTLVLRPVPYSEPGRLVSIWRTFQGEARAQFNAHKYQSLEQATQTMEQTALVGGVDAVLEGPERRELFKAARVSAKFFTVLRTNAYLGRAYFTPEEERNGGPNVIVISHGMWKSRFAADPSILTRSLKINGSPFSVVGVLPPGFTLASGSYAHAEAYLPTKFSPEELEPGAGSDFDVIGRMRQGIGLVGADQEVRAIAKRLGWTIASMRVAPLAEERVRPVKARLVLIQGAIALLLLIACSNASALLLARLVDREGILAVKSALGAPPFRLASEIVLEGVFLGCLGAILGLVIEYPLRLILSYQLGLAEAPPRSPWIIPIALSLGAASGFASSLLPAVKAYRSQPARVLAGFSGRATRTPGIRNALAGLLIALSFMLLAASSIMLRTLFSQIRRGPGFRTDHLYVCSLPLPRDRRNLAWGWATDLIGRLHGAPGLQGICVGGPVPILDAGGYGYTQTENGERKVKVWFHRMEGDIVKALGLSMVEGRTPVAGEIGAILISRPLAKELFPDGQAIGRTLLATGEVKTVVGVVEGSREIGLDDPLCPQVYQAIPRDVGLPSMDIVIRSAADAATVRAQLDAALRNLDADLGVRTLQPFDQIIADSTAGQKRTAIPLAILAICTAALSAFGLFGLLDEIFRARRRELAIRSAIGAEPSDLFFMVVGLGGRLLAFGMLCGMAGTAVMVRLLHTQVASLAAIDPLSLLASGLLLALAVMGACLPPALRASRMAPATLFDQG
ncbi:ABC transporter permease [Geothrix alkalitolerans]|uniref:ABC transporter permease n=1 Tax=Geothrix alkalitolerans TaxID=2922724 RepID=UPI001FAED58D|nr:ABC transporter permease [Geothrix alkalitolerans]